MFEPLDGSHNRRGFVYPSAGALVAFGEGGVRVVDVEGGCLSSVTGALADDLTKAVREGRLSPRLEALGPHHPAIHDLARLVGEPRVPLTATDALRLDGWDTLFLELTGRCNERCLHCYADSSPEVESALERHVCEEVIEDAAMLGFRRIQFTGGDPLLCEFLPDLVERVDRRRTPEVEVYTNGLALNQALLDRLAEHRTAFAFSFYSLDPSIHDAITRTPGSQRRTLGAIERARARGLDVRVAVVAMAENEATVPATLRFLESLGVDDAGTSPSFAVGRGLHHTPREASLAAIRHAGAEDSSQRGEGKLCVTYGGKVVPCVFNRREVLGDVRQNRLREIVEAPRLGPPRRLPGLPVDPMREDELQCASCRLTSLAMVELRRAADG